MPFNRNYINHVFPEKKVEVEKGRLVFFSKTIGETNPIYFDETEAHSKGHPSLLVPPTFLFSLSNIANCFLELPNNLVLCPKSMLMVTLLERTFAVPTI